ncbi:MAG: nucleoside phosphorylase [Chloroflexia bacterium]|nr:nucleoside phosphorylase [Chloroflexia bacterium]
MKWAPKESEPRTDSLPLLLRADHNEASVFLPENLLREARRQRGLSSGSVPPICFLDPDGDIVRHLHRDADAVRSGNWACYHTDLFETAREGLRFGIVGGAVGAPFAVLVAEELFASGCAFLVSMTSAGQLAEGLRLPCVILIEQALRGDGTSQRYLPPEPWVSADSLALTAAAHGLAMAGLTTIRGMVWTTDAPFRETPSSLADARAAGALAVEMEAAALYAFSQAREKPVICFAHVTNQMAQVDGDFEKGPADGAEQALAVMIAAAKGWLASRQEVSS